RRVTPQTNVSRSYEAAKADKVTIADGTKESYVQGEGPEGEGRETVQRYPANAQADHGERSVELAKWTFPIISLSREPYEAKVSRTGLTGGMGRRTVRQRALCLPSGNSRRPKNPVQCPFYHLCERAVPWYPIS